MKKLYINILMLLISIIFYLNGVLFVSGNNTNTNLNNRINTINSYKEGIKSQIGNNNASKVDKLLLKLLNKKSEFSSKEKYNEYLDKFLSRLETMKNKYKNKKTLALLGYLHAGVFEIIENQNLENGGIDEESDFWKEIENYNSQSDNIDGICGKEGESLRNTSLGPDNIENNKKPRYCCDGLIGNYKKGSNGQQLEGSSAICKKICPVFSLEENFCINGTIVSGTGSDGCALPPKCIPKTECIVEDTPNPNTFCKAGEKMRSTPYIDEKGCKNNKYSCYAYDCPIYSMTEPPIGCKYIDGENNKEGCPIPKLVCDIECEVMNAPNPNTFCKAGEKMRSTPYIDEKGCKNNKYSCYAYDCPQQNIINCNSDEKLIKGEITYNEGCAYTKMWCEKITCPQLSPLQCNQDEIIVSDGTETKLGTDGCMIYPKKWCKKICGKVGDKLINVSLGPNNLDNNKLPNQCCAGLEVIFPLSSNGIPLEGASAKCQCLASSMVIPVCNSWEILIPGGIDSNGCNLPSYCGFLSH